MEEARSNLESSRTQIEDFMKTSVWRDFQKILAKNIVIGHKKLEAVETLAEMNYFQGQIATCREMLELPSMMVDELKMEEDNAKIEQQLADDADDGGDSGFDPGDLF